METSHPPGRAIAIRASAVITLLGSAAMLFFVFRIVSRLFRGLPPPPAASPISPVVAIAVAGLICTALAGWGIATGVAIFRRRRWARISIIVFAALLALICLQGAVVMAILPFPMVADAQAIPDTVRWGIVAAYGALGAIGIWWLILFTRKRSIEYFTSGAPAPERARPLSISVIGWWLLVSAAMTMTVGVMRWPLVFAGFVATGWQSTLVGAALAGAEVYLGLGLLRLNDRARWWSIVFFALLAANGVLFWLLPGAADRMAAAIHEIAPALNQRMPNFPGTLSIMLSSMSAALFLVLPIWFLARRRQAFHS